MGKNNKDFSVENAMRLANSPAGQQLLAMLQAQGSGAMESLMEQISSGDYKNAGKSLKSMLSSPEAQQLLRKLEDH